MEGGNNPEHRTNCQHSEDDPLDFMLAEQSTERFVSGYGKIKHVAESPQRTKYSDHVKYEHKAHHKDFWHVWNALKCKRTNYENCSKCREKPSPIHNDGKGANKTVERGERGNLKTSIKSLRIQIGKHDCHSLQRPQNTDDNTNWYPKSAVL